MLDFLLYFYLYDMIFPIIDLQITCPNLPHRKEKEKKIMYLSHIGTLVGISLCI